MPLFRLPLPDIEPSINVFDMGPHVAGVTFGAIWNFFLEVGIYDDGTRTNSKHFYCLSKITSINSHLFFKFNLKTPFSQSILRSSLSNKLIILVSFIYFTQQFPPKNGHFHRRRIRLKLMTRHYLPRFHSLTKHHTIFHPPHCQAKITPKNAHFRHHLFIPRLFVKPLKFPKTPSLTNTLLHRPALSPISYPTTPTKHHYKTQFVPLLTTSSTPVLHRPIKMMLYGFSAPRRYPREGVG